MNIEAIISIAATICTLFLAIAAFLSLYSNNKQIKLLNRQIGLQRIKLLPDIRVSSYKFINDEITLKIENCSDSAGYWLGLCTSFQLPRATVYSDEKGTTVLKPEQVREYIKYNKMMYRKLHATMNETILYENKKLSPMPCVTFLANMKKRTTLLPGESTTITTKPYFCISNISRKSPTGSMKGILLSDLKEILLNNNYLYLYLNFSLVFRDIMGTPIGNEYLTQFVVDLPHNRTLEEEWKRAETLDLIPISIDGVGKNIEWITLDMYKGMKSIENMPEVWDKFEKGELK